MTAGAIPAERQHPVGVDFGSSGIKAALIDLDAGEFVGDRQRLETPAPGTPDPVASVVRDLMPGLSPTPRR